MRECWDRGRALTLRRTSRPAPQGQRKHTVHDLQQRPSARGQESRQSAKEMMYCKYFLAALVNGKSIYSATSKQAHQEKGLRQLAGRSPEAREA